MNMKLNKSYCLLLVMLMFAPTMAYSETDELQQTEASLEVSAKDPSFAQDVQSKYKLSDAQMTAMNDAGIKGPHLAMTAQLSASSGKPLEDIIRMRTVDKMGWGKIAKELGVHPSEIGQSVASLRRNNSDAKAEKEERKKMKNDRKQMRAEKKMERKGKKDQKKDEHP